MDSKTIASGGKVAKIECHDHVGAAIDGGLQHQFVARIAQLRTPQEPNVDRLEKIDHGAEKLSCFPRRQLSRLSMLGALTHGFIFYRERSRGEHLKFAVSRASEEFGRSA